MVHDPQIHQKEPLAGRPSIVDRGNVASVCRTDTGQVPCHPHALDIVCILGRTDGRTGPVDSHPSSSRGCRGGSRLAATNGKAGAERPRGSKQGQAGQAQVPLIDSARWTTATATTGRSSFERTVDSDISVSTQAAYQIDSIDRWISTSTAAVLLCKVFSLLLAYGQATPAQSTVAAANSPLHAQIHLPHRNLGQSGTSSLINSHSLSRHHVHTTAAPEDCGQAHRPACSSRAKGLLCQREDL